jgi:hypothetical protein
VSQARASDIDNLDAHASVALPERVQTRAEDRVEAAVDPDESPLRVGQFVNVGLVGQRASAPLLTIRSSCSWRR